MTPGTLKLGLAVDFAPLAVTAGVSDFNMISWQAANNAYLLMGLDPTDTTVVLTTQQMQDAPWLAEYFVLRSIVRVMAGAVDRKIADQSVSYSQAFKQAQTLLADAQKAIEARGYAITSDFTIGRLNVDYIEPYYSPGVSGNGYY